MTQSAPDLHKVYGRMDTGSFVVEAVLAELGLRFERILVPRDRPISEQADFLAVNPRGQVPAVITPARRDPDRERGDHLHSRRAPP